MSNKASDKLHQLIHSLSKAEKRYFNLYSSRHTIGNKNNYTLLFEYISKQREYSEEEIFKKFRGQAFLNKFSITKNRLYESILKSLDQFHSESSVEANIQKSLHSVEILFKKALYDHARKILNSAKRIALKNESINLLPEILKWEKALIEKDSYHAISVDQINNIQKESQAITKKIEVYNNLWYTKSLLFDILNKQGKARNNDELDHFKTIIDANLEDINQDHFFSRSEYLYYHILSAYYFGTGNYEKSYIYLKNNVDFIEKEKEKFQEEPNIYFSVLSNIIYVTAQLKKYNETFEYLDKLKALPTTLEIKGNDDLHMKLFTTSSITELSIYKLIGQFEKGLEVIPFIENGLQLYDEKISQIRKASFYLNIAVIYFGAEDYSNALKWINKLLNETGLSQNHNLHCYAQMVNLLIHLELGNNSLLPFALKSTARYLKSRNKSYKFEKHFMEFISDFLKSKSEDHKKEAYQTLFLSIEGLEHQDFENTAFEYFDFTSWAKSKIENRPFSKLVQEKAGVKQTTIPSLL